MVIFYNAFKTASTLDSTETTFSSTNFNAALMDNINILGKKSFPKFNDF